MLKTIAGAENTAPFFLLSIPCPLFVLYLYDNGQKETTENNKTTNKKPHNKAV